MKPTPDEVVAARIVEELRGRKLVPEERLGSLGERLASGSVTAEDWAFMVELASAELAGGGSGTD